MFALPGISNANSSRTAISLLNYGIVTSLNKKAIEESNKESFTEPKQDKMPRRRPTTQTQTNLSTFLDAEATDSQPSNQPQPPSGEAPPEKNDSLARGGLKTPPRPNLTKDASSEVPVNPPRGQTSDPPAQNTSKERKFPSKENSPCATKACLYNGTVYQFYHNAPKNVNKGKLYCSDCIDKFRSQSRARKKKSTAKSKLAKEFKKARLLLGMPEVVQTGLVNSVPIDDPEKEKLFDPDKHHVFVFSVEFSYQLLSSTQRLVRTGSWQPLCAPVVAKERHFGVYKSWGLDGDNDWKKSLQKALKVDTAGVDCDGQYSVLVGFVNWIQNHLDLSDENFFVKLSLIKTIKDVQQVS